MAYTTGDACIYDAWAALGNPGWDWASVLPYFKKVGAGISSFLGGP